MQGPASITPLTGQQHCQPTSWPLDETRVTRDTFQKDVTEINAIEPNSVHGIGEPGVQASAFTVFHTKSVCQIQGWEEWCLPNRHGINFKWKIDQSWIIPDLLIQARNY